MLEIRSRGNKGKHYVAYIWNFNYVFKFYSGIYYLSNDKMHTSFGLISHPCNDPIPPSSKLGTLKVAAEPQFAWDIRKMNWSLGEKSKAYGNFFLGEEILLSVKQ